jgi:hypothetical protein
VEGKSTVKALTVGGLMEKIHRGERKAISSYTYNLKG